MASKQVTWYRDIAVVRLKLPPVCEPKRFGRRSQWWFKVTVALLSSSCNYWLVKGSLVEARELLGEVLTGHRYGGARVRLKVRAVAGSPEVYCWTILVRGWGGLPGYDSS